LSVEYRNQSFDGLSFHDNARLHDYVYSESRFEPNIIIKNRKFHLALNVQPALPQFVRKADGVHGFKQSRPQRAMNRVNCTHHNLRNALNFCAGRFSVSPIVLSFALFAETLDGADSSPRTHHLFACCATFIGNPNKSMNPRAAVTSYPSMLKLANCGS
jgi:hypothetical protein